MAIDEAFSTNTGTQSSSTTLPGADISEAIVDGDFTGEILLQYQRTGSSTWFTIDKWSQGQEKAIQVMTPDSTLTYKFIGINIVGTPNVYLGP